MSCMGIMMKGFLKGFNRRLGHMFDVKEREIEIEIGGPTDVKHVGHIGWDGPAGSAGNGAPSWMGEFETGPNFASASIGRNPGKVLSPLTSTPEIDKETTDGSATPKKPRRKKHRRSSKSSSSASSTRTEGGSSGASGSSRKRRSKTKLSKGHAKKT